MTRMTIFPCAMWENPPHVHALKPRLFGKMLFQGERHPPSRVNFSECFKKKMLTPLFEPRTG